MADTPHVDNILTCNIVAMTELARFLSMVVVSLVISTSKCSSILVSLGWRIGSYGSTSVVEVGSCVIALVHECHVFSLERVVLPMVGSCVTTLGLVTCGLVCH